MDIVGHAQNVTQLADGETHLLNGTVADEVTVLQVGSNSLLTITPTALLVYIDKSEDRDGSKFCGSWGSRITRTWDIPLYNILWVELLQSELIIHYASPSGPDVIAAVLKVSVQPKLQPVEEWIAKLLDCSYRKSQRMKRAKVLVNPQSGQKRARVWFSKRIEPLLRAARCSIDMIETRHPGDGVSIAEQLDIDAFDIIIVCSGDGLAHEVFNGLGKRLDAKKALTTIAVAHVPCGSGNGLSRNLNCTGNVSKSTLAIIKGVRNPMDLVSITQGDRRTLSFLSQAIGMPAESDLATEYLRWIGEIRFRLGFLTRILTKKVYPAEISVKISIEDKSLIMDYYEKEKEKQASEGGHTNSRHPQDDPPKGAKDHTGLPPLKYGTIISETPEDWVVIPCANLGSLYCGNLAYMSTNAKFFRSALHNDGMIDLVLVDGNLRRRSVLQLFSAVATDRFFDSSLVKYHKILAYRWTPKNQESGYVSIDGESVPFEPFQAEVHQGLGTVIVRNSHIPGALISV